MLGLFGMFNSYDYDPEYENLSDEEKMYMDYTKKCLFNESEEVMDACTRMQLLLLEYRFKLDSEEEVNIEEFQSKKNEIYSELNKDDKEKVDSFLYACIQTMGIYSDEAKIERRLKKKGND